MAGSDERKDVPTVLKRKLSLGWETCDAFVTQGWVFLLLQVS